MELCEKSLPLLVFVLQRGLEIHKFITILEFQIESKGFRCFSYCFRWFQCWNERILRPERKVFCTLANNWQYCYELSNLNQKQLKKTFTLLAHDNDVVQHHDEVTMRPRFPHRMNKHFNRSSIINCNRHEHVILYPANRYKTLYGFRKYGGINTHWLFIEKGTKIETNSIYWRMFHRTMMRN